MKEILFKAKTEETREWIEGSLDLSGQTGFSHVIITHDKTKSWNCKFVDPETVCQFTGLSDKKGKKIFEGDILMVGDDKPMVVGWSDKFASFVLNRDGWMYSHWFGESCDSENCEIIGNIFDDPELLNQ